jgi:hypothetical protein
MLDLNKSTSLPVRAIDLPPIGAIMRSSNKVQYINLPSGPSEDAGNEGGS